MDEILIVDDSSINRLALANILQNDYTVICASSAKEMFHVLEESDPKLILLDIIMPEISGFDAIAKLKSSEEYSKIPVIFITGLDDPSSEEKGFQLGAIDYITKPFKHNVVRARVQSYIQLYDFIQQTEKLSQYDGLTGLYNKKTTEHRIRKQLSSQPQLECGALMIIDVDNFKSINDTFGHLYGDAVLTQLGSSLRSIFQKSDILGRIGGDEFFVFLRNYQSIEIIEKRASEVCSKFSQSYSQKGKTIDISASIGIATTDFSFEFESLYEYADMALYGTKSRGKNGFTFYDGNDFTEYTSNRTQIDTLKASNDDPEQNIKQFSESLSDYMYSLSKDEKIVEYTFQSILNMISKQFHFDFAYITKLDYEETGVTCTYNWLTTDEKSNPHTVALPFAEITNLYNTFKMNDVIVSYPNKHSHIYSITQKNNKTFCIFPLRNTKNLLGFIGFEKVAEENEFNSKQLKSISNICQQFSTLIINQFLVENIAKSRDNYIEILNNLDTPIYITQPNISHPIFENKASKNDILSFHGKNCFKPDSLCHDCVLKEAISNNGFYSNSELSCKEINWTNGSKAYLITKV